MLPYFTRIALLSTASIFTCTLLSHLPLPCTPSFSPRLHSLRFHFKLLSIHTKSIHIKSARFTLLELQLLSIHTKFPRFAFRSSLIVQTVFFHRLLCVPESFPVFRFSSVAISTATN
ncbi:hypothetical protein LXL04_022706, partial [Taraxacum kok-saghyz]